MLLLASCPQLLSPGCVRRASFAAPFYGETTSELIVAQRGDPDNEAHATSSLVWRQLDSATRLNLLGDGSHLPEFGVLLEGGPGVTLVTLTYNFASARMHGPLCFLVMCMPQLLKWHLHTKIASEWHLQMLYRNHVPRKRPFRRLANDVDEEERIKLSARDSYR